MTGVYGGIEAGGTKFVCVVGSGPGDIRATIRLATGEPQSTLEQVTGFFRAYLDSGGSLDAIGIASFGPTELRIGHPKYGSITTTPKPGWSDTDLVGPLRKAFSVPVVLDTDVNGAALAEGRWGAARGLSTYVYVTVGTGIGGGGVVGGRVLHGLIHPEMGHISIPRQPGDDYPGSCPFHGDCFEGMASGPAMASRWGRPAEELRGHDLEEAVELEAAYIAAGLRTIVYVLAPERIVLGGGVCSLPGLLPAVGRKLAGTLAGYPGLAEHQTDTFVVPAALGASAGSLGALVLGEIALSPST